MRCLRQTGKVATHNRIFFKLGQRHQCSDSQSAFAIRFDLIKPANAFKIDHAHGARDVILHRRQKILPPGDWSRGVIEIRRHGCGLEGADGFGDRARADPLERVHARLLSLIRPIRILSGVMGSSRTRTPQALKTAFATAPTAGMIAASAMPMTTSRLSSSSMMGIISGISSGPGIL